MKSRKQIQTDYNLEAPPSAHLLELIERAKGITQADLDTAQPPIGLVGTATTPEGILDAVRGTLIAQSVGELLEAARKSAGLTLQQLGEAVGVSKARIDQLENPQANLELATLAKLAAALDVQLEVRLIPNDPAKKQLVTRIGSITSAG